MSRVLRVIRIRLKRYKEFKYWKNKLKSGKYCADKHFKCYSRTDCQSLSYARSKLKKKMCAYLTFSSKGKQNVDAGTVLLFSNSATDKGVPLSVKIFDLQERIVTTFYNDNDKFRADLTDTKALSKYFPIPERLSCDEKNMVISERLINVVSVSDLSCQERVSIFSKVIRDYTSYYNFENNRNPDKFNLDHCGEISYLIEQLGSDINSIIPVTFVQHGDLTLNNVLWEKDNDKVYYIDFEHCKPYIFFYDLFWLVHNDFIYNNSRILLDEYLSGTFDEDLEILFSSAGAIYNKTIRKKYFYSFLIAMYQNRIQQLDKKNKKVALWSLKKIFNYIKSYKEISE